MGDIDPKPETRTEDAARSKALVLAFRVVLLLVATVAAAGALVLGRDRDRSSTESRARYGCPMHPDVMSAAPGQCPICGMDLEPVQTSADARGTRGIEQSTYMNYDVMRRRGTGPDAPSPAWVAADGAITAVVYDDELYALPPDAPAVFMLSGPPRQFAVKPVLDSAQRWDVSTSRLRFRLDAPASGASPDGAPRPGEVGRIRFTARGSELPLIAASALLESADGPYVMVASPDARSLSKRPVRIGKTFGGMVFVLSGLGPRERVLTRSAFFVDAERRLRKDSSLEVTR